MSERWWVQQPPDIVMTDAKARALISGRVDPKDNAEWAFLQANASTMIPENQGFKIVPLGQKLSLHKPTKNAPVVYGEE